MIRDALYTTTGAKSLPPMTVADWKAVSSAEFIEILFILKACADAGDRPGNRFHIRPDRAPIPCWRMALIARAHLRMRFRTSEDGHASIWPAIELEEWR